MLRYVFKDPRTGNYLYRHALPDGSKFVRSFKTTDYKLVERQWSTIDAEYNAKAQTQRLTQKYVDSKDARREKFWAAAGRWMIHMKAGNGGTLPRPAKVELPTATRVTSHPFWFVRSSFLQWAQENDPDAVQVFALGDMNEEPLFSSGLVAAYFTLSEMERLHVANTPTAVIPQPRVLIEDQHSLEQVYGHWVKETNPAVSTQGDVRRAMAIFAEANPETDSDRPLSVEQINRKHIQRFRERLSELPLTNVTRNKRMAGISLLLGQAVRSFWIDVNLTVGARFEIKDGDQTQRKGFAVADVDKWMSHPVFSEHKFGFFGWSEYWVPLLALWHGMRRSEIGQLMTSDIRREDGIWTINIDGTVGGGNGKKIKTVSSRRCIAIHPQIIKMGFVRWVQKLPPGRLFDNLRIEADGNISAISGFVREQLDQVGLTGFSLHGARHAFRTQARAAKIAEEVVDMIVGHAAVGNQGRKYGHVPLKTMADAMARINLGAMPKPYGA